MKNLKTLAWPALMLAIFEGVAIALWRGKHNPFYLFNFSYIGCSLAVGLYLYGRGARHARRVVQFLVGGYMLCYLGLYRGENMQIEGFWYALFQGTFEAAAIHYAVAKLLGPLLFGRGWCGYACWTAMILDLLPYRHPAAPRKKCAWPRYAMFALSLAFVAGLFLSRAGDMDGIMFRSFLIGNALYYTLGVGLALILRDNRAFCKYVCPVAVFLKPISYYALMRVTVDPSACVSCGKCKKVCPMDVDMTDNSRRRANGTECILCLECVEACPKKALKF